MREGISKGKAWLFGDNLDSDSHIFPFRYVLKLSNGAPFEKLASHVMEPVNPEFGKMVQKGDFVVAGRNFGHGKAHLEGAEALKLLGISAVIDESVASGFFKNALYYALPVITGDGLSEKIRQGDELEVNVQTGEIKNLSTGENFQANPAVPPGHPLFPIMQAGGQIEYIKHEVEKLKKAHGSC